jgi:formyl-CoA transferase
MLDEYPRLMPPVRMTRSTGVTGPAPLCGQHTDSVLAELGYETGRVAALRASGVIG